MIDPAARGRAGAGHDAPAPAVTCCGVTKRYGKTEALAGIDLTVPAGSITAVLGPNGAGKSTTMEILTGLRLRDAGSVEVLGLDPGRHLRQLAERVGVQVQEFNLQPTVKVRESLQFFSSLYRAPLDVDDILERFGLADKANALFPSLSGGQKRRLAIARALVGDPELVVLDEPTSGLDPQGQQFLRHQTRRLREDGRTVLLSTHDVADAEALADIVVIIDDGRVVASGKPAEIVAAQCHGWRLEVKGPVPGAATNCSCCWLVPDIEDHAVLYTADHDHGHALLSGAQVVSERSPNLHDAYFLLTGTALRV